MKKRLLLSMLAFVACLVGFTAQAMLTTSIRFRGFTRTQNNTSLCAGMVESMWGTFQTPTQSGNSYTFNNYVIRGEADITLNGTLKFQEATSPTDVINMTEFTVTVESNTLWFYSASVKTSSNASVSGCSVSVSSDKHTVTVTIPFGKTFGYIYLDYVPNEPLSSSNTTISGIDSEYIYYGSPIEPVPTVAYYGTTLTESTDYTLSYSGSNGAGTARVTVNGTGSYTGSVYKSYTIRNIALSDFNSLGNNTYEIATKEDLLNLACFVNYAGNNCQGLTFKQTADITCDNTYIPIGDYSHSFNGTYDGQGHTISGITVSRTGSGDANSYLGVFGNLGAGGVVKDIVLAQSSFTGANRVGGIVGYNNGGTVRDCRVESGVSVMTSVNNSYDHGGVVGLNIGGSSLIAGCVSAAAVSNSGKTDCKEYGGIAGGNNNGATIRDCLYTGGIVTASNNIGAIAGYITNGNFTNNYYTSSGIYGANGSDRDGARRARTVTLVGDISLVGEETAYDLSDLTAIGNGNYALRSGATIYSGEGQTLTLSYNGEVPAGYALGYSVNGTLIEGNTFEMPAQDVTVTATTTAIDYTITLPTDLEHATVTSDKATAHVGETVTLTVTPDEGYAVESLAVMNGDNEVEVTEGENNTFTFEMPAADVTVSVEIQRLRYTFNTTTGELKLIYGEFNKDNKWGSEVQPDSVKSVTATSEVSFTGDCSELFYVFKNCESMDLNSVNTSEMTNCNNMFFRCQSLDTLDLSDWNTSNVTNMNQMFCGCSGLTSLDLSGWNTANVTNMGSMFYTCRALTSLDVSNFDTGNVTNMSSMFELCALGSLDLSNFNTGKVTNMCSMFNYCISLTSLDLSNFDTGNVTSMSSMFESCSSLTSLDLSSFDTGKVTDMSGMFSDCNSLTTIYAGSGWSTESVEESDWMFDYCGSLVGGMGTTFTWDHTDAEYARIDGGPDCPGYFTDVQLPRYTFNSTTGELKLNWGEFNKDNKWGDEVDEVAVTSVTATSDVSFTGDCTELFSEFLICESMDLNNVNTDGVTNMSGMFNTCWKLDSLDLSSWNTGNVTDMSAMFYNCNDMISLDLSGWNTANVTDMGLMFNNCFALTTLDVSGFNTANVTDMNRMFNDCRALTSLDLSGWNTSNVTDMSSMFYECNNLTTLDVSNFNTANVTDMSSMFEGCWSLASLDVSGWNTANVFNMYSMFNSCWGLDSLDVSGFNTAGVTSMGYMFSDCSGLTSLDLSGWNTANVTDMNRMFKSCSALTSLDLSGWNTANVTYMINMFYECNSLTTIYAGAGWSTESVEEYGSDQMFYNCTSLVGGMGTTYDANHTDAQYARIDGGPDCPGYFTSNQLPRYTFNSFSGELELLWGEFNKDNKWGDEVDPRDVKTVTATNEVSFTGDCSMLFYNFTQCTSMDLSNVNTDSVTLINSMFGNCWSLTTLDVSGWNTSNVTNMGGIFNSCSSLTTIDLSSWNTSRVTDMGSMFAFCPRLTTIDLSGWNTASVTDMNFMFSGCSNLKTLELSTWDVSNVSEMYNMFSNCDSLQTVDVSGWNTSNVTDMDGMFCDCESLTTIHAGPSWSTARLFSSNNMFTGSTSLVGGMGTTYDANHTDAEYARIDGGPDCPGYFTRGSRYTFNSTTGELKLLWGEFNKNDKWGDDVDEEAVTSVTATSEVSFTGDCSELFYDFYNCKSMDLSNVNTDSVTNMSEMFFDCCSLASLNLSGWNTANVTNMSDMFSECYNLTPLDLSGWNTTNVTDMRDMFFGCDKLSSLDLSGWNTANVTDMSGMFHECTNLTSLDISSWNTANVTNMSDMFFHCGLTSLDLSNFDTGNVTDMRNMFYYCGNLTTIYAGTGWSTESVESSDDMFTYCGSLVGGMGTTYDENHTDAEYARIDGGPDSPGYFSEKNPVVVVTGDVDGDGYVTTVDITAIYNYLLNGDETYLSTSDVDGDGFITTTDITVIYNILLGN